MPAAGVARVRLVVWQMLGPAHGQVGGRLSAFVEDGPMIRVAIRRVMGVWRYLRVRVMLELEFCLTSRQEWLQWTS
jgi:hypothetical protein